MTGPQEAAVRNLGKALVETCVECKNGVVFFRDFPRQPRMVPLWKMKAVAMKPEGKDTNTALRIVLFRLWALIEEEARRAD